LEAFQVGFLADHKRYIKLDTIKAIILKEFKNLITLKSSLDPRLRELIMTDVIFSSDNENKYKRRSNVITSSSWFNAELDLIKINTFKLIDYLENGIFNIDVVDFVPILLAEGFKCELNLYQYELKNDEDNSLKLDEGNLFHGSKFLPGGRSGENLSARYSKIPEVKLIYLRNQMHYITNTKVKLSAEVMNRLKFENKNSKSIIPDLLNDPFYSKIAKNFHKSKTNTNIKYFIIYDNQIL